MSPAASGLVFVRSTCQRITESINTHSEVPILSKSDDASLLARGWRNLTVRAQVQRHVAARPTPNDGV